MARSDAVALNDMSDAELRELAQQIRETLSERVTRRIDEFRILAREAGFEVSLTKMGEAETRQRRRRRSAAEGGDDRRGSVAPKYRNPDNPSDVWSGRGRKPKWVEEKLAAGRELAEMQIADTQQAA
jgi:DNA-binding protein H-NS